MSVVEEAVPLAYNQVRAGAASQPIRRDGASQQGLTVELLHLRRVLALALTSAAAALLVTATFVPINGGGRSGYPQRIYDSSAPRQLQLFALEPIGVAAIASLVAIVALLRARVRPFVGGILVAFGIQSGLLFLAYFGSATFGNPEFNSFAKGSALGLVAAALMIVAGTMTLLTDAGRRVSAGASRRS